MSGGLGYGEVKEGIPMKVGRKSTMDHARGKEKKDIGQGRKMSIIRAFREKNVHIGHLK